MLTYNELKYRLRESQEEVRRLRLELAEFIQRIRAETERIETVGDVYDEGLVLPVLKRIGNGLPVGSSWAVATTHAIESLRTGGGEISDDLR